MYADQFRLKKHKGTWCICYSSNQFNEPVRLHQFWPTTCQDFDPALDGAFAGDAGCGLFNVADERIPVNCHGRVVRVALRDGGKTKPIDSIDEPISAPAKRGKPLRYKNGQWQRQLARGWVSV